MLRPPDPRRVERLLGGGDDVVALVAASPYGVIADTVGAVIARSVGLGRRTVAPDERWDSATGAFVAVASPVDLGGRRQVLLALTAPSERLVVIGVDRLGRPVDVVWWVPVADVEGVSMEPVRLLGVATEALELTVPDGRLRFVLARPDRRSGHDLAARLGPGMRYSGG